MRPKKKNNIFYAFVAAAQVNALIKTVMLTYILFLLLQAYQLGTIK